MKKWLLILIPALIALGASSSQAGGRHGGHHGYRHHGGHHGNSAGYLIGGLALGSLLTHAYHRNRHQPHYPRPTTYPVYRDAAPVITGRRFYRDIDGNCFERLHDQSGNELLKELPRTDCDW